MAGKIKAKLLLILSLFLLVMPIVSAALQDSVSDAFNSLGSLIKFFANNAEVSTFVLLFGLSLALTLIGAFNFFGDNRSKNAVILAAVSISLIFSLSATIFITRVLQIDLFSLLGPIVIIILLTAAFALMGYFAHKKDSDGKALPYIIVIGYMMLYKVLTSQNFFPNLVDNLGGLGAWIQIIYALCFLALIFVVGTQIFSFINEASSRGAVGKAIGSATGSIAESAAELRQAPGKYRERKKQLEQSGSLLEREDKTLSLMGAILDVIEKGFKENNKKMSEKAFGRLRQFADRSTNLLSSAYVLERKFSGKMSVKDQKLLKGLHGEISALNERLHEFIDDLADEINKIPESGDVDIPSEIGYIRNTISNLLIKERELSVQEDRIAENVDKISKIARQDTSFQRAY